MTADLHIHTNASDGIFTPQEILIQAERAGLSHIAITDHDTVTGLLAIAESHHSSLSPSVIPGLELSTDLPRNEVHILGYYIDVTHAELNRQIKIIAADRFNRAERIVHKLIKLGFPVSYQRVLEIAGKSTAVGRPHIAAALLEKGYFTTMEEVFDNLLKKNKPAYIPHYKLTPQETVDLIKLAGGVPVLAHPGLVGNDQIVLDTIRLGIGGIEVYHPKHTQQQVEKYHELAARHSLAITGGSDFHGIPGRFPERLGEFTISSETIYLLQQRIRHQ
jgi:predicted metal-dependent phosphoesterase TrpH